MDSRPPKVMEKGVRLLVPPASREHVMGDLAECYVSPWQYFTAALRTIPFVIASQVRRTSSAVFLAFSAVVLWVIVFYGYAQESWLAATIPTVLFLLMLILRDAYRPLNAEFPPSIRQAATDVASAAAGVLLWQALAALTAPTLLLSQEDLLGSFPPGCLVMFVLRLKIPAGIVRSRVVDDRISMTDLLQQMSNTRRARSVLIGMSLALALCFATAIWTASEPIEKTGCAVSVAGMLFFAWFVHRYVNMESIPDGAGFAQVLAIYRAHLKKRIALWRNCVWWGALPMAAGPVVMAGETGDTVGLVIILLICAWVVVGGKRVARRLQRRLDQLQLVVTET